MTERVDSSQCKSIAASHGKTLLAVRIVRSFARNDAELNRVICYVECNPVTAGLVGAIEDWPWSNAGRGRGAGENAFST